MDWGIANGVYREGGDTCYNVGLAFPDATTKLGSLGASDDGVRGPDEVVHARGQPRSAQRTLRV